MKFISNHSGVAKKDIDRVVEVLAPYNAYLRDVVVPSGYEQDESSINLSIDKDLLAHVGDMVNDKTTPALKYIIIVGIGGSNLGIKALYDSMYGYFDVITPERFPKMIFIDTSSPEFLGNCISFLEHQINQPEEVIVNVISKSGGTTETIVNAELVISSLEEHFPSILDRIVVTTNFDSRLWKIAEGKEISTLAIPERVGGRFSVFSAVGLFPLALMDMNITALLSGAREMREACLFNDEIEKNIAMHSAGIVYFHMKRGIAISNTFAFNPEFEGVGEWYRQLLAESIGKEKNRGGEIIHTGILPIVSIGSTDLHSVGQLYLGGPKNILTTFVYTEEGQEGKPIAMRTFPDIIEGIEEKTPRDIMTAIRKGVREAYIKRDLPFTEIVLSDMSLSSMGKFMQFKMMEVMYLGKLLRINSFDQPNVEEYKTETKRILDGM